MLTEFSVLADVKNQVIATLNFDQRLLKILEREFMRYLMPLGVSTCSLHGKCIDQMFK